MKKYRRATQMHKRTTAGARSEGQAVAARSWPAHHFDCFQRKTHPPQKQTRSHVSRAAAGRPRYRYRTVRPHRRDPKHAPGQTGGLGPGHARLLAVAEPRRKRRTVDQPEPSGEAGSRG